MTDGVAGARIYADDTHLVFNVGNLMAGTWQVNVTAATGAVDYLGVLSGDDRRAAALDVRFGGSHDDAAHAAAGVRYLWGLPQPIVAVMKDRLGVIDGGEVVASVTHPDGSVLALPLFDDALHGDGNEGDGVYANAYTRTTSAAAVGGVGSEGSYRVTVLGTGTNNQSEPIARVKKAAFVVAELGDPPPDSDGDAMPDRYEALHACLDGAVPDANTDHDRDGLLAVKEWEAGTKPCHPDTDEGGETDGSELSRAANPFDHRDDALPAPIDPEVVDWRFEHMPFDSGIALAPGTNLIRYPVHRTYQQIRIWRATSEAGPYAIVAALTGTQLSGLYQDGGLANGTTYYYMVQPVGSGGTLGAPSLVFSGTPRAEPVPPIGSLEIAGGLPFTSTPSVKLTLTASLDVLDMRISNQPDLSSVVWQPFQFQTAWTLQPDATTGIAPVYVEYRGSAGNLSPSTYNDSITVVPGGSLGSVSGLVTLDGQSTPAGVVISLVGGADLPPGLSDGTGSFSLQSIPAGVYTVVVSYPGFQDATIAGVVVSGGLNTQLGAIHLSLPGAVSLSAWTLLLAALGLAAAGLVRAESRLTITGTDRGSGRGAGS